MSETVNNASAEAIQQVITWLAELKDGVCEQAPLLAEEIVRYGVVVHTFWVVACLLLLSATAIMVVYVVRRAEKMKDDEQSSVEAAFFFGLLFALLGSVVLCVNVSALVQVLVAPRLYILSELKQLL